ncbi:MAG: DUF4340 domain-containing protein [Deltaproteobacteria bacterium]|nr:DUF4340 domain-containing protein [Deltaproteobacteria bacterium]
MKRLHRALLSTAAVLGAGGALALYAWIDTYQGGRQRQLASDEEKRLYHFGRIDVRSGTLTKSNLELRFQWKEREGWWLTDPVVGPADQEAMTSLIDNMVGMKIDSVVEMDASEEDLAKYELSPAHTSLELSLADGRQVALHIGAKNEIDDHYFVTDRDRKRIARADGAFSWAFDRDLYAFRGKRIFDLHRDQLTYAAVERDGAPLYALERRETQWIVQAAGRSLPADPYVVDRYLLGLTRDLKADSYPTDALALTPEDLARYGLDRPAFRIRLREDRGIERVALVGTPPAPEGASPEDPPGPYVLIEGSRSVAEVFQGLAADLTRDLSYFRDRTISSFQLDHVAKVDLHLLSGERAIVERAGGTGEESTWSLTLPQTAPARSWRIQKLLLTLSNLRSDRVETDTATTAQLQEWRLDPPEQRIIALDASGKVLADVQIGKAIDTETVFITATGLGHVDGIKEARLGVVPKSLEDIVEKATP